MRTRVAGLVKVDGKYGLMFRKNVKETVGTNKPFGDYYVFPGGGVEEGEDLITACQREIKEEFGIDVKVNNQIAYRVVNEDNEEYLFDCEYVSGKFGTGDGPEFSGDPKYIDRGEYIPSLISIEEFKSLRIIPEIFKEKVIEINL